MLVTIYLSGVCVSNDHLHFVMFITTNSPQMPKFVELLMA